MPVKSTIPAGVQEGVRRQLASKKKCSPNLLKEVCSHWQITESQAKLIQQRDKAEINELRQALSTACFELAGHAAGEISKKLGDPMAMAETPLRDLAMTAEKLVNAGVTAADGHKPMIALNFGDLREGRNMLAERDRRMRELKQAREVTT